MTDHALTCLFVALVAGALHVAEILLHHIIAESGRDHLTPAALVATPESLDA